MKLSQKKKRMYARRALSSLLLLCLLASVYFLLVHPTFKSRKPVQAQTPLVSSSPTVSAEATPLVDLPTPTPTPMPTPTPTPEVDVKKSEPFELEGLVLLTALDDSFVIDLKYATSDNFTGKIIYQNALCLIQKSTAQKLIKAHTALKLLGYRIKIFDAYRPHATQQVLWDAASDKSFVADPKKGSIHNRGAAIDITLVDDAGNELSMPSGYDEFTKRARLDFYDCPKEDIEHRELLGSTMVRHGFKRIRNEWWHFEDTDAKKYPILNIQFDDFSLQNE